MQKTRKYKCVKIDLVVEKKSVRYKSRGCIMLSKLFTTVVTWSENKGIYIITENIDQVLFI